MPEEPDEVMQSEAQPQPQEDANLARLRELARSGEKALAEAAELRKELAQVRSGIDFESKLGRVFQAGYQGDRTDPEAMRAEAASLEIPMRSGYEIPEVAYEENGTEARRSLACEGAIVDDGTDLRHPSTIAEDRYNAVVAGGTPRDQAMGGWVASMARSAMSGDPRAIYREGS